MRHVPEIKLIRTDTTLDLSQKAEKVCLPKGRGPALVPRLGQPGVMGRAPGRARRRPAKRDNPLERPHCRRPKPHAHAPKIKKKKINKIK